MVQMWQTHIADVIPARREASDKLAYRICRDTSSDTKTVNLLLVKFLFRDLARTKACHADVSVSAIVTHDWFSPANTVIT